MSDKLVLFFTIESDTIKETTEAVEAITQGGIPHVRGEITILKGYLADQAVETIRVFAEQ